MTGEEVKLSMTGEKMKFTMTGEEDDSCQDELKHTHTYTHKDTNKNQQQQQQQQKSVLGQCTTKLMTAEKRERDRENLTLATFTLFSSKRIVQSRRRPDGHRLGLIGLGSVQLIWKRNNTKHLDPHLLD